MKDVPISENMESWDAETMQTTSVGRMPNQIADDNMRAVSRPKRVIYISRNSKCPCGSGLRYKRCCEGRGR